MHRTYGTPYRITVGTGVFVAFLAAVVPLEELAVLVGIGTLFAFFLVSIGVWWLRRTRPDLQRSFRVPFIEVLPWVSAAACLWLMANLPAEAWVRFGIRMAIGVGMYFLYSRRHSRMATGERRPAGAEDVPHR